MENIALGLKRVRARLAAALVSAGREAASARLIAVSKFQPASAIRVAYAEGQRDFGENYVQELEQKAAELSDLSELRWHMIGHLQRNKARVVAPLASLIHTVHSVELVHELDKRANGVSLLGTRSFVVGESRLAVLVMREMTCANDVLPDPGGPHRINEGTRSFSIASRRRRPPRKRPS